MFLTTFLWVYMVLRLLTAFEVRCEDCTIFAGIQLLPQDFCIFHSSVIDFLNSCAATLSLALAVLRHCIDRLYFYYMLVP